MPAKSPAKISHAAVAIAWAKKTVADTKGKRNGLLARQAAQRFLDDLKRAKSRDCEFEFDEDLANHACRFIERLPHVEGTWATPTIVLHPAQVFFVAQLFGFRNRATGNRRFTSALYCTARKSGKSTVAAAVMLYCQCCEAEVGAQLISAATTYDQAAIVWKIAATMAQRTEGLRDAFGLKCWAKVIARPSRGSLFKALHAKASTQDGLNPSHVVLDEVHAHKSPDLLNVLTSAAGARSNPLWLYTTTEGYINAGPWAEIRQFAKRLLSGVFGQTADHYLAVVFAIDDENKTLGIKADDEFDERCWIKANPLIEENPHLLTAIRREAIEAKQMPSKLAEFRIKRLNRQSATADGWINLTHWQKCDGDVDLDMLADHPCYGGLDLASTSDIASFRLVWNVGGKLYTHGWRWAPQSAVRYRSERGTVPYAAWVEAGHLIATTGNVIDYAEIEPVIVGACERFRIQQIGYDRWNATELANRLVAQGIPLLEFIQGPRSYHPAMQALERAYMAGNFAHGGDPVLNWCASNVVARRDVNLNMAPDKKNSADKIDDMSALLMAVGVSCGQEVSDEGDFEEFMRSPLIASRR